MVAAFAHVAESRAGEGCAIAFDGQHAIAWSRRGTTLVAGNDARAIEATIASAAAVGRELWVVAANGGAWSVAAWAWDGHVLGECGRLPIGGAMELVGSPVSATGYAYGSEGSCEILREAGEWKITELAGPDRVVPIGARRSVERRGARLILRRPGHEQTIAEDEALLGGTVMGGGTLAGDLYGAVELSGCGQRRLLVLDFRRGGIVRVLRVQDDSRIVLVPAAGHVLIQRAGSVTVIDAVRNQRLVERDCEAVALAVSGNATRVALLDADGALQLVPYADFARRDARTAVVVEPTPESSDSPIDETTSCEPTATEVIDAPASAAPRSDVPDVPGAPAPDVALPDAPLLALCPRRAMPGFEPRELDAYLASMFELIAALCARALASSWDSGRLGIAQSELPYADEMAAILDGRSGRAAPRLAEATERERAAWEAFASWNRPGAPHMELAAELGLSSLATALVLVAAAPSIWGELARVYGVLCNDLARPLCDELLVAHILGAGTRTRRDLTRELDDSGPLVRHGVITRGPGRRPFGELVVAPAIVARLAGDRDVPGRIGHVEPREADRSLEALRVPRGPLAELLAALAAPPDGGPARIVIRGRAGSGRRSVAAALAARAGRIVGAIELPAGSPEAIVGALREALRDAHLRGWLPCISGLELAGDEPAIAAQIRRVLADHPGPLVVRTSIGITPPLAPGYLSLDLPSIPAADREQAWVDALSRAELPVAAARSLAARYDVGPGVMARTTTHVARAGATGSVELRLDHAMRQYRAERIGAVAKRVDRLASWDDLVLPDEVLVSVRDLCDRVRNRGRVLDTWGLGRIASTNRGVTALFQGGPGTGKTMMAGAVARELGFELYRVDLSKILSKWIGETEKNLATVFDAAEDGEMVLLFDEADALFARRTEVKSSNDRHANNEVNYLLQRLDTFEGVAILTTNFGTSIDDAFRRRLSLRLTVPFPEEDLRVRLWNAHLPDPALVDGDLDLTALAHRYAMSGAYIRNAALRAAYLAAARGCRITGSLLEEAVRAEYRDADRIAHSGPLS